MFEIESGITQRPKLIIVFGPPGVGKSHLASRWGNALMCDLENGTDLLDVKRVKPKNYEELLKSFKWFSEQPFDTIVIDSITALEKMSNAYTLAANSWATLEDPGYGKGYTVANQNFNRIIAGCEYLRNCGKNVVLIGHSKVKAVTDPTQDAYDRMEFDVNKNLVSSIVSVFDGCYYLRPQVRSVENKGKEKRALSSGVRELLLVDKGGAIAKNRMNHMPDLVEFQNIKDPVKLSEQYTKFWKELNHVNV